jgi:hypothetical protein
MVRKSMLAAALILALVGTGWRGATAAPITYTLDFTASGTLDGQPFDDEPIRLTASTDTDRVLSAGDGRQLVAAVAAFRRKDEPIQMPVGQPVALVLVAAALLFLPTIINLTGATPFGTDGHGMVVESAAAFGSYKLWRPQPAADVKVRLSRPLKLTLVRDHRPVKLVIRSIHGNRAVFRAEVAGGHQ